MRHSPRRRLMTLLRLGVSHREHTMAFPPIKPIPDVPPPVFEPDGLPQGGDDPLPPYPDKQIEPLDPDDEAEDQAPRPPPV